MKRFINDLMKIEDIPVTHSRMWVLNEYNKVPPLFYIGKSAYRQNQKNFTLW